MTDRELMQQALDALEEARFLYGIKEAGEKLQDDLRARLAQPEPEPVAVDSDKVICPSCCHQFRAIPVNVQQLMIDAGFRPPFTAPPQREWQGLTDEELLDIADMAYANDLELLQTLQAKLKEKNHG